METTTALSTQLAGLPAIVEANKALADRALMIVDAKLNSIVQIDLKAMDVLAGDAIDNDLSILQTQVADAIEINKQRRMPITKAFDEFRSQFTSQEKAMEGKLDHVKMWRSNWNKEKYDRRQEEERRQAEELKRKNAGTDYQAAITMAINDYHTANLKDWIAKLGQAFYSTPVEHFDDYELRLKGYTPQLAPFNYNVPDSPYLAPEEMAMLKEKVQNEMYPILNTHFVEEMSRERDRLIAMIPSRVAELRRLAQDPAAADQANARIAQEHTERMQELDAQAQNMQQAAAATAEMDKLNNLYETAAAQPAISLSKGTTVKKKYNPTTHQAMVAIISRWVAKDMVLLTMEELTKKLSFMITAANKALNAGETLVAEGLLIEEDMTVRGKRS